MKSVSAGLNTHLQGELTTLALCWKVTAVDNTVLGFTSHTADLVIDSVTYKSTTGISPSTWVGSAGMEVDNLDVAGILAATGIDEADIRNEKWDFASVEVFLVNYNVLADGILKIKKGTLGEIKTGRLEFGAEMRSLLNAYTRQVLEIYQPACRVDLGDSKCQVRLDPPAWQASTAYTVRTAGAAETGNVVKPTTPNGAHFKCIVAGTSGGTEPTWDPVIGNQTTDATVTWEAVTQKTTIGTVSLVVDRREFEDNNVTEATGFFDGGLCTWTSGSNNGRKMEVKTWNQGTKRFELVIPMAFDITVSDTFKVTAGCLKSFAICETKFDNVINFRGEPHIPSSPEIIRVRGVTMRTSGGK